MSKEEFRQLFLTNVASALADAEGQLGRKLSKDFDVELHGAGCTGEVISPVQALDRIYLGDDVFFRIIDIGVKSVTKDRAVVFVRVSAHPPSKFSDTWNTPKGNGPFKVVASMQIRQ
jgi:hypothetical protein